MRKIWKAIGISTALVVMTFNMCLAQDTKDIVTNVTVEGSIFGGSKESRIETILTYNPTWITTGDNTVYNSDLAKFCSIICADTYFREKDLEKGSQNRVLFEGENVEEYTNTALLTSLEFEDVQYIETYKVGDYTVDTNDSATFLIGYQNVDDMYDVFVVAFRGCFSSGEWISIFDMGSTSDAYTEITGEHPEWNCTEEHKGVSIAAARAEEFIDEYIAAHSSPDRKTFVLTTGHSRGGSIANLIGAKMEKEEDIESYTYTFSAGGVTEDSQAKEYKTIFNISDSNDIFENVTPFRDESLIRYGEDLQMDILSSEEAKTSIANIKGKDDFISLSADQKAEYIELFGKRFADRDSLYEMHNMVTTFESQDDAEQYYTECQNLIGSEEGLGIEEYCQLGEITENSDGTYEVALSYCDEALLAGYGKIFAYGDAAYQGTIQLFQNDTEGCKVAAFINEHSAELRAGHLIVNSYGILDMI